jgi:hypothetical protein
MRIIGYGIDVVKVAGIKEELESANKRWAEQFCSPAEREQADGRYWGRETAAGPVLPAEPQFFIANRFPFHRVTLGSEKNGPALPFQHPAPVAARSEFALFGRCDNRMSLKECDCHCPERKTHEWNFR